mgnify:CR=1 FL=1
MVSMMGIISQRTSLPFRKSTQKMLPLPKQAGLRLVILLAVLVGAWLGGARGVQARPVGSTATPPDYSSPFRHLTPREGLPHPAAFDFLQDRLGFMWIATFDGLVRYDGYIFRTYRWEHDNVNSITGNNVSSLYESSTGMLWVGTSEGLNAFDPQRETFTRYVNDPGDPSSLLNNRVNDIVEDADGFIWLGTSGGLDRLDPATGQFTHFRHDDADSGSLAHDEISNLCFDQTGDLWVATYGGGLDRLGWGGERFVHHRHNPNDPGSVGSDFLEAVTCDPAGMIWVGTWGAGLDRLDDPSGDFYHYPAGPRGIAADNVKDIFRDREGTVWVATYGGGLSRIDPSTGDITTYADVAGDPASLGTNAVTKIFQDQSGMIWFGSESAGISLMDPYRKPFAQLKHNPSAPGSIAKEPPIAFLETAGGDLWIGYLGGGLSYGTPDLGTFRHWRNDPANPASLASNSVFAIHQDSDGALWVGTLAGLDRYSPEADAFTHFKHDPADPGSLSENSVYGLLEDSRGNLWVGTYNGLNRLDKTTGRFTRYIHDPWDDHSLGGNIVYTLYEDREGFIWVGMSGTGLDRFDPTTGEFSHFRHAPDDANSLSANTISDILEDRHGRMWIATWGNGLDLLDRETGRATHYHEGDGLISNKIQGLIEGFDSDGNTILWISTTRGLSRFDPQTVEFTNYDESDGLFASGFVLRAFYRGDSGRLYAGSSEGVNYFLPEAIEQDAFSPPIVLTDLVVNNEPRGVGGLLPESISRAERIQLPPSADSFAFEFAALDFRSPANNRYRYRLNGYDRNWIEAGSGHRIAHYANLDPGQYVFQVPGTNYDETWSSTVRELVIEVIPAWWQTRAFMAGSIALAAGAVFVATQARRRANRQAIQRLEGLVAERTQELTTQLDMMEQLTSNLDADSLLQEIFSLLEQSLAFDIILVGLSEGDQARVRFFEDKTSQYNFDGLRVPIAEFAPLQTMLEEGRVFSLANLADDALLMEKVEALTATSLPPSAWIGAPLKARSRIFGFLLLANLRPAAFKPSDVRILTQYAHSVAIALDNAQLYSQVYAASLEEERARLARDLHDSVTQILFSANLLAEVLPRQLHTDPVEAENNLREIKRLLRAAMAEARVLLFELRPVAVESVPLGELLAQLTESITSRSDVDFHLSLENVPVLPPEVQIVFYRVAQEALNNVVKHSKAGVVTVALQAKPGFNSPAVAQARSITLSVSDNGIGLSHSNGRQGGFGWVSMRERATSINARLRITGKPDAGTQVVLTWRGGLGESDATTAPRSSHHR